MANITTRTTRIILFRFRRLFTGVFPVLFVLAERLRLATKKALRSDALNENRVERLGKLLPLENVSL